MAIKKDSIVQDNSPTKRNARPIQLHAIKEEKKEAETPPKSGKDQTKTLKPKPIMVDAVTQTERSDYHQLKVRDLKKQLRRAETEAAEA